MRVSAPLLVPHLIWLDHILDVVGVLEGLGLHALLRIPSNITSNTRIAQ